MVTTLRMATPGDAKAIADIHAENWRRHYRGAYSDAYLDGDIASERLALWSGRLAHPDAAALTLVAVDADALLGFAHTIAGHDAIYGALLDNLHVKPGLNRRGVGSALMRETARVLIERNASGGLYLWVLEQNVNAQAFYAARGGVCVAREMFGPLPGGGETPAFRYYWADPAGTLGA